MLTPRELALLTQAVQDSITLCKSNYLYKQATELQALLPKLEGLVLTIENNPDQPFGSKTQRLVCENALIKAPGEVTPQSTRAQHRQEKAFKACPFLTLDEPSEEQIRACGCPECKDMICELEAGSHLDAFFQPKREQFFETIQPGDKVRSYDFDSRQDCYVEGTVIAIVQEGGCSRYEIAIAKMVYRDNEIPCAVTKCLPPVNGTPIAGGNRRTNFVRKIS